MSIIDYSHQALSVATAKSTNQTKQLKLHLNGSPRIAITCAELFGWNSQRINQPTNQPTKQPTNQPINQPRTDQPSNQPSRQSNNQVTKHPLNQDIKETAKKPLGCLCQTVPKPLSATNSWLFHRKFREESKKNNTSVKIKLCRLQGCCIIFETFDPLYSNHEYSNPKPSKKSKPK